MLYAVCVILKGENLLSRHVLQLLLAEHPHYGAVVPDNGTMPPIKVMLELVGDASHYSKALKLFVMIFSFGFREPSACIPDHKFGTRGVVLYKNSPCPTRLASICTFVSQSLWK